MGRARASQGREDQAREQEDSNDRFHADVLGLAHYFRNDQNGQVTFSKLERVDAPRIEDLNVFVRIAERGAFSAVAGELHITPGAISKQVARLETRLGVRLFERSTRSVKLTDEGQAALVYARAALASIDGLTDVALRSRGVLEGTVRVTAPAPFGRKFAAPLIGEFRTLHPKVDFDLQLSDQIVDLLRSDVDLAIRIGKMPDSSLVARRIAASERLLVAAPSYVRRFGAPARPTDLSQHTCLVFSYPGVLHNVWSLRSGRRRARVTVTGELRSDNGEVLRDWCVQGLGISLRESWDVMSELESGTLVRVLPSWETEATSIFAVRAPRTPLPYRIAAFLDFMAERWRVAPWAQSARPTE